MPRCFWFSRTARHVGVILLAFGCDGSPGLQKGTDDPGTTGRADSEQERVEFFGEIVDPGPDPTTTGRADSEQERQGSGPREDLELLPAPLLLKAGKDPVHSVAFSPDGNILAAGDGMNEGFAYRGKLYLWETRSGKLIRKHEGFRWPVERICFSDSGKVVAASSAFRGPVIVWEVGQEGRKAILPASSYVLGLTSETEALVAVERSVGERNEAPQWDIARWRFDQPLKPEDVVIQKAGAVMGLSGNKEVLFGYYPDGKVVFWSTGDWKKLGAIDVGDGDPHAISGDGRLFAARVDDDDPGYLGCERAEAFSAVPAVDERCSPQHGVSRLGRDPRGELLLGLVPQGSQDGTVHCDLVAAHAQWQSKQLQHHVVGVLP